MQALRIKIIWLALFFTVCAPIQAGSAEDHVKMLRKINDRYQQTVSLRAEFVQREKLATLGRTRESKGTIFLKKPGKMRWEYKEPEPQTIITDGRTLWMYYPEEKTVYRFALSERDLSKTPLAVIFQEKRSLMEFFKAESVMPTPEGLVKLNIKPLHEEQDVSSVSFIADPEEGTLSGTVIKDIFGNTTEILLGETVEGEDLSEKMFIFQIPPGTRVLTDRDQLIQ